MVSSVVHLEYRTEFTREERTRVTVYNGNESVLMRMGVYSESV